MWQQYGAAVSLHASDCNFRSHVVGKSRKLRALAWLERRHIVLEMQEHEKPRAFGVFAPGDATEIWPDWHIAHYTLVTVHVLFVVIECAVDHDEMRVNRLFNHVSIGFFSWRFGWIIFYCWRSWPLHVNRESSTQTLILQLWLLTV